jgi:hypothetical protein
MSHATDKEMQCKVLKQQKQEIHNLVNQPHNEDNKTEPEEVKQSVCSGA